MPTSKDHPLIPKQEPGSHDRPDSSPQAPNTPTGFLWMQRYPVLDEEHVDQLGMDAAVAEFGQGMSRHAAEEHAYGKYKRNQALDAAAHHFHGMKAARAIGDMDAAQQYGLMYDQHLRTAGLDPYGPVPDEIHQRLAGGKPPIYRFKPHAADKLLGGD